MTRRQNLLSNANTVDYHESYLKTQPYNTIRDAYNLNFESYITGINQVLQIFANKKPKPYVASPEQARVIYSLADIIAVIASAGSGKTSTILYKLYINRVILKWKESDILAVTYTNDAAKNMRDSYKDLVKNQVDAPLVDFKTIHKFGKEFIEIANPSIQLVTEDKPYVERFFDQDIEEYVEFTTTIHEFLRKAIKQNGLECDGLTTGKVLSALSVVSEKMITSEEKFRDCEQFMDFPISFDDLIKIKATYSADKTARGCMDYVDMLEAIHALLSALQSLDQLPDIRIRNHLTYKAIYVDEVQDISPLQISIINHLRRLNPGSQLTVVGDDDQSIFDFRGANPDYLVNIQNYYPLAEGQKENLEVIYMTYNRRSAPLIVRTMNKVIEHNKIRYDKVARAFNEHLEGDIKIIQDVNCSISRTIIINKAKELYSKYQSAREMAVLYREHVQAVPIINKLVEERIPFNIGESFNKQLLIHNHFVVKDMLGIMQMLLDLHNPYTIANYLHKLCPYMGEKTAKSISEQLAQENNKPIDERKKLSQIISEHGKQSSNKVILQCLNLVKQSASKPDNLELIDTIYSYYRKAYLDWYLSRKDREEAEQCDLALQYLLSKQAVGYNLLKNAVLDDRNWAASHCNFSLGVKLRTFHTSKGLEWKHVYLLPVSNKVCPKTAVLTKLSKESAQAYIEEERRLFYVACTRAISNLTVFYSQDDEKDMNVFIEELKQALYETKAEMEMERRVAEQQARALDNQNQQQVPQHETSEIQTYPHEPTENNVPLPQYDGVGTDASMPQYI